MENTGAASAKLSPHTLTPQINHRTGHICKVNAFPIKATARIKALLISSQSYKGHKIFNCLPREVRELIGYSVDKFKSWLDKVLSQLPNEPPVSGYRTLHNSNKFNTRPDAHTTHRSRFWEHRWST